MLSAAGSTGGAGGRCLDPSSPPGPVPVPAVEVLQLSIMSMHVNSLIMQIGFEARAEGTPGQATSKSALLHHVHCNEM